MKKVKVTDLSVYLAKKSIGKQMEERGLEVRDVLAIVVNEANGKAIITDNDAVHNLVTLDEKISFDLFEKMKKREDGSQVISLGPAARVTMTVAELLEGATDEVELSDFVRRFGHRIETNYRILLKSIKEIGLDPEDYPRKEKEASNG